MEVPPDPNVTSEDRMVPGPDGAPHQGADRRRWTRPGRFPGSTTSTAAACPGDLDGEARRPRRSATRGRGGRLRRVPAGPRAPLPGAGRGLLRRPGLDGRPAAELGFDPGRLAVYGGSAGGGLTIAITMLARATAAARDPLQMPVYPMIHDRNDTRPATRSPTSGRGTGAGNIEAWKWYLGHGKAYQSRPPARRISPAAAHLHRRPHGPPVPGRGHRVRAAAHASRCADRAARQSRFLSRGGSVRA